MPSICANVKRKIPHFYYIFAPGAQSGEVPLSAHVFSSDVILYVCEFSKREIIPILYNIPQHLLRVAAQPPPQHLENLSFLPLFLIFFCVTKTTLEWRRQKLLARLQLAQGLLYSSTHRGNFDAN
jgi:hypothetical protein